MERGDNRHFWARRFDAKSTTLFTHRSTPMFAIIHRHLPGLLFLRLYDLFVLCQYFKVDDVLVWFKLTLVADQVDVSGRQVRSVICWSICKSGFKRQLLVPWVVNRALLTIFLYVKVAIFGHVLLLVQVLRLLDLETLKMRLLVLHDIRKHVDHWSTHHQLEERVFFIIDKSGVEESILAVGLQISRFYQKCLNLVSVEFNEAVKVKIDIVVWSILVDELLEVREG